MVEIVPIIGKIRIMLLTNVLLTKMTYFILEHIYHTDIQVKVETENVELLII